MTVPQDPVLRFEQSMILALDIGNTNIALGVFDVEASSLYKPEATWRMATESGRSSDEYGILITNMLHQSGILPDRITAVVICSVVPPLTYSFVDLSQSYFELDPLVVGTGVKTGVKVRYDTPRDVGSDRIADAAAVLELYGGPAIIVDMGTGTVFDAISAEGEYIGGAIAPGITVAADALFHSASQLRRVELISPPTAIGKNTVNAIQAGLVLGYVEMVKGMVSRFNQEMGGGCKVIGTGGLVNVIQDEIDIFDLVNQDLTLAGLRIIHKLNTE